MATQVNVGGGRSAGRGGPTVEELRDYERRRKSPETILRNFEPPQMPAAARMAFESAAKERANKAAEKHFPENPDPEEIAPKVKKAMGGKVKAYRKGGVTRADGCVSKGRTKGRMV